MRSLYDQEKMTKPNPTILYPSIARFCLLPKNFYYISRQPIISHIYMDLSILQAFITLPFILLVICIGILTEFFKKTLPKIARKIAPNTPDRLDNIVSFIWSELVLPFLPIFIGIAIGIYIDDMMIPDVISQKMRVMYFAFAGFLSSHCYDRIKKFIKKEGE